jgi:hypothetical protein
MLSKGPKRAPWDQRLAEGLARQSWEAANNPAGRLQDPPMREQIRSPYYKLAALAWVGALVAYLIGEATWIRLAAAPLYIAGLVLGQLAFREARAASLLRNQTKEKT